MSKKDPILFDLHEVVDIVRNMCNLQVSGKDTAIPMLRGAPGAGKTESIRHMAMDDGDLFLSCHFALKQPEDLGGIPQFEKIVINDEEILSTKWSIPEILETLLRMSEDARKREKKVIFFLDDIHRCGPFHVTALFELLSERKIREIHIPDNVAIVLAGNGSLKAGAQLTNSAIINRCAVLDVRTNFDYWREHYAMKNHFNLHLLAFLQNNRYRKWFHSDEDINDPWASPRAWSKLSNVLNIYLDGSKKVPTSLIEYICQAHVGQEATKDFITYYQIIGKFNVAKIFNDIQTSLKTKTHKEVLEQTIQLIQGYDELQQFALSQAFLIEFTSKDAKNRKKNNYHEIMSLCIHAISMNPKGAMTEGSISLLKDLLSFIIEDNDEKALFRSVFNDVSKKVGGMTLTELVNRTFDVK